MVPTSWDPLSKGGVLGGGLGPLRASRGRRRSGWKRSRRTREPHDLELHTTAPTFLPSPLPRAAHPRSEALRGTELLCSKAAGPPSESALWLLRVRSSGSDAAPWPQRGHRWARPGRAQPRCTRPGFCSVWGRRRGERSFTLKVKFRKNKNPCVYLSLENINLAILEN